MVVIEEVEEASDNKSTVFIVSKAGCEDCNGLFIPTGRLWHGAAVFENDKGCLLSREPHRSQKTGVTTYGWILGLNSRPLYAVQSDSLEPPTSGWRKFGGRLPLPQLQVASSSTEGALSVTSVLQDRSTELLKTQQHEEAETTLSRALNVANQFCKTEAIVVELLVNRSEARLCLHRWGDALEDAEEALVQEPRQEKALLYAARAAKSLGRYEEASSFLRRCIAACPKHKEASQLLEDVDRIRCAEDSEFQRGGRTPAQISGGYQAVADTSRGDTTASKRIDTKPARCMKAFEGYCAAKKAKASAQDANIPVSELPYHHMGLPKDQTEKIDKIFQEARENTEQARLNEKNVQEEYERVKLEYKLRAEEDLAAGRIEPLQKLLPPESERKVREANGRQPVETKGNTPKATPVQRRNGHAKSQSRVPLVDRIRLSEEEKDEIDRLFEPYDALSKGAATQKETHAARKALTISAAESHVHGQLLDQLRAIAALRGPTRFEQAGGELYCWWTLPSEVSGKHIQVTCAKGGTWLTVTVCGVAIFDHQLFLSIKSDDIVWSFEEGELHLTLTKGERNTLWEQLANVPEVDFDEDGNVKQETLPAAMSANERVKKFQEILTGDDGNCEAYSDLDPKQRELVDAFRRYEHARATGDQRALYEAEEDLEDFGRLVI